MEEVDPMFVEALISLQETGQEILFKRFGQRYQAYELHGKIVAINSVEKKISIERTRSHAGEIHEMGIRNFISATGSTGQEYKHQKAFSQYEANLCRIAAWQEGVTRALIEPDYKPQSLGSTSQFVRESFGHIKGHAVRLFIFSDSKDPDVEVAICAKSRDAAEHFMILVDAFITLDDLCPRMLLAHFLWPAWLEYEESALANETKTQVNWPDFFRIFDGIPISALSVYTNLALSEKWEFEEPHGHISEEVNVLLSHRLVRQIRRTPEEILRRTGIRVLRAFVKEAGSSFKAQSGEAIRAHLLESMPSCLEQHLKREEGRAIYELAAPSEMSLPQLNATLRECRNMIHSLRHWLRFDKAGPDARKFFSRSIET
jgi:hypothetical protein